jgi:hypothetical protein
MWPSGYRPILYNTLDYASTTGILSLETADTRYNRRYGINYCSDIYASGSASITGALSAGSLTIGGVAVVAGGITQATADGRYLQLTGGTISGNITGLQPALTASSLAPSYPIVAYHNVSTNGAQTGIAFSIISGYSASTPGAAIMHRRIGSNSQGNLEFYCKASSGGTDTLSEWLRITYNGRVGLNVAGERFYGSRGRIDSNQYCLFGTCADGGDGTFSDKLVYQVSPEMLSCATGFTCSSLSASQVSTNRLLIGSTDTARLISALDSGMATGTSRYITLGKENSVKNQAEISFYYDSSGSNSNRLEFGFYGGSTVYLLANGRVGVGTSTPSCGLDVATGENSVTFTTNVAVNSLSYAISSNSWTNFGGGPYSANICARFRGSVWIQDRLWATSDRRLKDDIKPIDFDLEHYSKLNPVSYKWKNQQAVQLGLIAQEVKSICSEAVSYTQNENMQGGDDDEPEGYQLTVDYNCVNMMNVVVIKKLIGRVEDQQRQIDSLRDLVDKLITRPVVQRWLAKST